MIYRILTGVLCFCAVGTLQAQVLQSGTLVDVKSGTSIVTSEGIDINTGAELRNEGSITFAKDLNNNGVAFIGGDMIAAGRVQQTIGGLDSLSFNNLTVNNKAGVTLGSKSSITNRLTMEEGIFTTSELTPVILKPTAENFAEHRSSYISGTSIMEPRNIGTNALDYMGVAISAGDDLGNVTVVRRTGNNAVMQIGNSETIEANWDIETSTENPAGHDLALSWVDPLNNNLDIPRMSLYGNVYFDEARYVKLDAKVLTIEPISQKLTTGLVTYSRTNLDYINRRYTVSDFIAQQDEMPIARITTWPNPVTDRIHVLLENYEVFATAVKIAITDETGKIYHTEVHPLNGNIIILDNLGWLPNGLYRLIISRGLRYQVSNFVKINN